MDFLLDHFDEIPEELKAILCPPVDGSDTS